MRKKERIKGILDRVYTVWVQYPDLRLGQLLLNASHDPELYYIEDEDLADRLEAVYRIKDLVE